MEIASIYEAAVLPKKDKSKLNRIFRAKISLRINPEICRIVLIKEL